MPIFRGSRYEGVPYTGVKTRDGKTRKFLHDRRVFTQDDIGERAFEHVVVGQEQLDGLANLYYNDQNLWWLIADVNNIFFALDIQPGDILFIPEKDLVAELGLLT